MVARLHGGAEAREAERNIMRGACSLGIERTCQRLMAELHMTCETRMAAYARPQRNARTGRFTRRSR